MGYTHYWRFKKQKEPFFELYDNATKHVSQLLDSILPLTGINLQGVDEDINKPLLSPHIICFNGVGEDEYEDFTIGRGYYDTFNFCKTARKPYDLCVMIALILYLDYAQTLIFQVESDGHWEDWKVAFDFLDKIGFKVKDSTKKYFKSF